MKYTLHRKFLLIITCIIIVIPSSACEEYRKKKKTVDTVINCIEKQDSDGILSEFALKYQKENGFKTDLFKCLEQLYSLQLDFKKTTQKEGPESKEYKNGNLVYYSTSTIIENLADADGNVYSLYLSYTIENEDDKEDIGVQSIQLFLEKEDHYEEYLFIGRDVFDKSSKSYYCFICEEDDE